jgi:hypothetical protein
MKYDGLEKAYWEQQIARVEKLRQRIVARSQVSLGHVVPEDTDLVIGTGRRLDATVTFTDISKFSRRQSIKC